MEHLDVILSAGTRARINRIKKLRREQSGVILDDQEIVTAAIALYWSTLESRQYATTVTNVVTEGDRLHRAHVDERIRKLRKPGKNL